MRHTRTEALMGGAAAERLGAATVAVFGLGGVGGHAAEAIARSGVGRMILFDSDVVSESDRNRQIIALSSTLGRSKTEVMRGRIADIDPDIKVETHEVFYLPENADSYDLSQCDYILDAVDTVSAKLEIVTRAKRLGIPVISAMGTGNKLHPELLEITDIYKTSVCPLARTMRRELKKRGIDSLTVVYSREEPKKCGDVIGSCAFVPSVAGLMMAGKAVRDIAGI